MAKNTDAFKVKLIKGASFVIPGYKFVAGQWADVNGEVAEKLKPSQQFVIKPASDVEDEEPEVETEAEESEEDDAPVTPKKKPRRKRR